MIEAERLGRVPRALTPWLAPDDFEPPEQAATDRVFRGGTVLVVLGVILQTAVHTINALVGDDPYLSVNSENNPIAWSHGVAIFASAFVCALRALLVEAGRLTYAAIAAILTFFSLDEMVMIHERVVSRVIEWLELAETWDSVLWPIVYLPLGAVLALLLLRVARTTPHSAGRRIILSLALLFAAVALEVVSAPWSDAEGGSIHTVEGAIEEAAELAAWLLLATALTATTIARIIQSATARSERP